MPIRHAAIRQRPARASTGSSRAAWRAGSSANSRLAPNATPRAASIAQNGTGPEVHPRYILMLIPLMLLPLSWYLKEIRPDYIRKLCWVAIVLLALRVVFDFTVLPTRQLNSDEVLSKQSAIELAEKSKGKELYSYWNDDFEPDFYYMTNFLAFRYHFHLAAARDEILYNISEKKEGAWYFSANRHIGNDSIIRIGTVDQHLDDTSPLPLFIFYATD